MVKDKIEIICLEIGGPPIRLQVGKTYHTFEMHRYCGPLRLYSDGDTPNQNGWSDKSTFWPVFDRWLEQGKRVDQYGRGIVEDWGREIV